MSPVSASHSSNPNHKNTYRSVQTTANGNIKTIHMLTSQAQSIYCKLNLRGSATKREDRFRCVPLRIRSGTPSAAVTASVNTGRVKSAQARHEAAHQQGGGHTIQESPSMHTHTRVPSGIPPSRSSSSMTFRYLCASIVATKLKVDSFIDWTRKRTSLILYSVICQHARVSMDTTRSMQTTLASASTVDKETNR